MYRPFLAALLGLLSVLLPRPSSAAVDEAALLPVDEAFVLQAHAPSRERIELQWRIADGYYLYRHQIRVKASGGFTGGELELPPGRPHVDEFFGRVETYRGRLLATLAGQPAATPAPAVLEVRYQGCADDMFKVSGIWGSPFEVATALASHPAVQEAIVIKRRNADGLLKPTAFVVLKDEEVGADDALFEALREHGKAQAGPWKYPRWIEAVPELPKTATNKIRRVRLREAGEEAG